MNTKSYLDKHVLFPNVRYFSYLNRLGIRVQVNSDAHYPERINDGRREALQALHRAGYRSVMELHDGKWQPVPLTV